MDKHVATMRPVLGDTIIKEFDRQTGVCRDTKSVTITAETNLGAVIDPDTGAPLLAANVASATSVWILADEDLYTKVDADGTYDLAVWLGAPGASGFNLIRRAGLSFGDALSEAQIDTVVTLLNAQGARVE